MCPCHNESTPFNIIEATQVYAPTNLNSWGMIFLNKHPQGTPLTFEGNTGIQNATELHTDPASNGPAQANKHPRILSRGAKQHQAK